MRPLLRAGTLMAALLVLCLCAACGLPPAGHSETIDKSDVPFGLLDPPPSETAPPRPLGPATLLYFVRDDRLATALRRVVDDHDPAEVVRLLLAGPTRQEVARKLTSDVPEGTRLISLDVSGDVATVDLSEEFGTAGGSEQVLAVAQIVYTLTASDRIDAVRFAIDGKVIEVPDGSGSLAKAPRSRADYPQVAPP